MGRERRIAARNGTGARIDVARSRSWAPRYAYLELVGIIALVALAIFFIAISWRKWPDPLIDFGRELYLPWRIANGAILYRDVQDQFGPLSQMFNALLFRIFGAGLMVLTTANLAIFAAIVTTIYCVARRAWGAVGAVSASAVFIAVFGFTQLVRVSNYTYAAPYAHETTHGMLVVVVLTAALVHWVENPSPRWALAAGLLFGLTAVLKAEFVLAAGSLGAAAALFRWRYSGLPRTNEIVAAALGAVIPTAVFTAYFAAFFPLKVALLKTTQAWLRFATSGPAHAITPVQAGFTGLDQPGSHFAEQAVATLIGCGVIAAIASVAGASKKIARPRWLIAVGVVATLVVATCSWRFIVWPEIGKSLLGLILVYTVAQIALILRAQPPNEWLAARFARLLIALLGLVMMTRMALNGRIYQYGFYQAAIAGCVLPAILVSEIAEWIRAAQRERIFMMALSAGLLFPGVFDIARQSHAMFAAKTASVGEGVDQFYSFDRRLDPTGEIVNVMARALRTTNAVQSLVVIPEGVMINYLARIPNPTTNYFFWATNEGTPAFMEANPPQGVLLISRDLREYGIEKFGLQRGQGKELLDWLQQHYRKVAHAGGDPLDSRQRGATLLQRIGAP